MTKNPEGKKKGRKGKGKQSSTRYKGRGKPKITLQQYQAMLASFVIHRNNRKAAEAAGVGMACAANYINKGYPNHGMPSIKEMADKASARASKMEEITLAKFRAQVLSSVMAGLETSTEELKLHGMLTQAKFEKMKNALPDEEGNVPLAAPAMPFKDQVAAHNTLARLGERSLGAADETIVDASTENVLAQMTTEEKRVYVETAVLPIRFRK